MNLDDKIRTIAAMRLYGGSFVVALAVAYERADANNAARIEMAFSDYIWQYGPSGPYYNKKEGN